MQEFVPARPADRRSIPDDVPWQFQRRQRLPTDAPISSASLAAVPLSTPRRLPLTANSDPL